MSPRQYLSALLRPHEAFDGWTPPLSAAVGLVVLLCALNAASVAYAGDAIAGEVTGTVTIDNPERPPDWVCDGPSAGEVGFGGCEEPETVERSLRSAATGATDDVILKAALAPLAWTLLIGALFVIVLRRAGGSDGEAADAFRSGLGVGAVAAVPGSLRSLGRPIAVERALSDWSYPGTLDGVRTATVHTLFPDGLLWVAVVVASGVWTAFVLYGGVSSADERTESGATVIATAGFVAVAASLLPANGGWIGMPGGFGLLLIAGGVVAVIGSYTFIELSKKHELIGFRGKEQVEPKGWYVALHRIGACLAVAVGFVLLDGHALV